jgi:hypothetical protein
MSDNVVEVVEKMKKEKKKLPKKKEKKAPTKPPVDPVDYSAIRRNGKKGVTLTLTKKINFKVTDREEVEKFYEEFDSAEDAQSKNDIIQTWVAKLWDQYDEELKEWEDQEEENED